MGTDKANIVVGERTMLAHVAAALEAVDDLVVVGGRSGLKGVRHLDDEEPGQGPLGGFLTGARSTRADVVIFAACDLPRLEPSTVETLVQALARSDAAYAVPLANGVRQWHLLAARRSAVGHLRERFDHGIRSLRRAYAGLPSVCVLPTDSSSLQDVDTPKDLAALSSGIERI